MGKAQKNKTSPSVSPRSFTPPSGKQPYVSQHPMKTEMYKAKEREDELKLQRKISREELGQGQCSFSVALP